MTTHQQTGGQTRRQFLTRTGTLGLATIGALSLPVAFAPAVGAAPRKQSIVGVDLTAYPFPANLQRTMTPAPERLDALAAAYGKTTQTPTMDDFLLGWAPSRLFEDALAPRGSGPELDEALWILHLTGYFGGIWLRLKFIEFSGPRFGSIPTEASFNALAARLDAAVATLEGSDEGALAAAEASLRGAQQVALADSYGYNAGYLDQILTGSKPTNVVAPTGVFDFTDSGVFDATYGGTELKHLARWRNMARPGNASWRSEITRITEGSGGPDALGAIQAAGAARGRLTWTSPFLSITNWDQPSYDSLISTSTSFLQAIQNTGFAALAGAARGRSDWARQSVWANALLGPFGGSYGVGLFDRTYDAVPVADALPSFRMG
jgi:hypothetical protein